MTEMASCQRIYEQKAYEAEEKLRKHRKDNPQKGDGKKTDKDEKKGDNAKPGKSGKMSEKEIRQAAKAAVARQSGKAVNLDDEEVGRVGRKVWMISIISHNWTDFNSRDWLYFQLMLRKRTLVFLSPVGSSPFHSNNTSQIIRLEITV